MKLNFILNKYNGENNFIQEFTREFPDAILGRINTDLALTNYEFSSVGKENLDNLEMIFTNIQACTPVQDSYHKLKVFEETKVL